MMLGRPTMTRPSAVPLPEAIDDEYIQPGLQSCKQPENVVSKVEFYVQTLKLYHILRDVLSEVYEPGMDDEDRDLAQNKRFESSRAQVLIDLDSELLQFQLKLPEALRWDGGDQASEMARPFRRESSLLQARLAVQIPLRLC